MNFFEWECFASFLRAILEHFLGIHLRVEFECIPRVSRFRKTEPKICLCLVDFLISHQWTVHIEPPVTDEVLLIEDGPVWAKECVLEKSTNTVICTNMKTLTFSFGIAVVTLKMMYFLVITDPVIRPHITPTSILSPHVKEVSGGWLNTG